MKAVIEVPFRALEEYVDDGLGKALALCKADYISIQPLHGRKKMLYVLHGTKEQIDPVKSILMRIILTHAKENRGRRI